MHFPDITGAMSAMADKLAKLDKITAALPQIASIVKMLAVLAPNSAGLVKADAAVTLIMQILPELRDCEAELRTAITGLVNVFRADGSIPPAAPAVGGSTPAPVPANPAIPSL